MTDILMPIFKIIFFIFLMYFCYTCSYAVSPYNPDKPHMKYITIKNKTLARLLISKGNSKKQHIKNDDKCKLSVISLLFYIIQVVLLIVSIVLQIIPQIPCEPFAFYLGRHGAHFQLNTLNEKIPLILSTLLVIIEMLSILLPAFINKIKKKEVKISYVFTILLSFFLAIYLVINLINF